MTVKNINKIIFIILIILLINYFGCKGDSKNNSSLKQVTFNKMMSDTDLNNIKNILKDLNNENTKKNNNNSEKSIKPEKISIEYIGGNDIVFPDEILGFNFKTVTGKNIFDQLTEDKIKFTVYDFDSDSIIYDSDFPEKKYPFDNFIQTNIISKTYLRSEINPEMINEFVFNQTFGDALNLEITLKIEYSEILKKKLYHRLGRENIYFERRGDKTNISWYADADEKVEKCIYNVELIYDKALQDVFVLKVHTVFRDKSFNHCH